MTKYEYRMVKMRYRKNKKTVHCQVQDYGWQAGRNWRIWQLLWIWRLVYMAYYLGTLVLKNMILKENR